MKHKMVNGKKVPLSDQDIKDLKAIEKKFKEKRKKFGYVGKRRKAYLPVKDQLDMLYHDLIDGTAKWKAHIEKVKKKYPKGK